MHSCCEDYCPKFVRRPVYERVEVFTPTDVERSCSWKTIRHDFHQIGFSRRAKRLQERLQGCCPDAEKDKNVDD